MITGIVAGAPISGGGGDEHIPVAWLMDSAPYAGHNATVANMRDGDFTTGAAPTSAFNCWIKADLGAPKQVGKVGVAGGDLSVWGGVAYYLNDRLIQYSHDDSIWTTVATVSGASDSPPYVAEMSFTPVTARWWRVTNIGGASYLATTEFRFY